MQTSDKNPMLWLELAIPLFSFGGVLAAILLEMSGSSQYFPYTAIGCVIASFILAYLAYIRPSKDIVALTTPIYSVLFFVVPTDFAVNFILEFLYAVSLTILLVRMKIRFGDVRGAAVMNTKTLEGPLHDFCESLQGRASGISPETAHSAAVVFARFAEGDFREAAQSAGAAKRVLDDTSAWPLLATAFDIVREQALLLDESADRPEHFIEFPDTDAGVLAKPLPPKDNLNDRFEVSLDNALLILYATAWNASLTDRPRLLTGQSFALKILNP